VDGRLGWTDESDGCLDPFLASDGGRTPDFSVVADAGVGSTCFDVVPVVKRKVLGLGTDGFDASDGVVTAGVVGRLADVGVPTIAEPKMGVAGTSWALGPDVVDESLVVVDVEGFGGKSILVGLS
jgi:hypothetical protein